MAGVNKVTLLGRLGRDPEKRAFANGGGVVSFSLATSESWKKDGERQERTEWHQIQIFNEKLGEVAERYLKKGSQVYLEGQIQSRKYKSKEGDERTAFEIVIPKFGGTLQLVDAKGAGGSGGGDSRAEQPAERKQPAMAGGDDWDAPF